MIHRYESPRCRVAPSAPTRPTTCYDERARVWRQDGASAATAALCSCCTHLPDGQFPHARHAKIARRANLPQVSALAASGKSERSSRASCLDEEGRYGQSSRYVGRGCDGRGCHVRRTWPFADSEVAWSRPPDAEVKLAMMLRITLATGAIKPGPRGDRDISRKPSRRECRLIRLNLW
jgi:hypothetical protein